MMERMMERELALRVADQLRGARPAMVCNVGCRLIVAALIERVLGDQIRALTLDEIAEADRMLDKMMLMRRQLAEFPLAGGRLRPAEDTRRDGNFFGRKRIRPLTGRHKALTPTPPSKMRSARLSRSGQRGLRSGTSMTPRPDTEFSAWEARVGLPDAAATAKVLGITRPAVYQLRAGRWRPHSSTKQLMRLIEANPRLVRQLMALSEADP